MSNFEQSDNPEYANACVRSALQLDPEYAFILKWYVREATDIRFRLAILMERPPTESEQMLISDALGLIAGDYPNLADIDYDIEILGAWNLP